MKKRFVDPFFPNRPVDDPRRFSGRSEQVDEVIDSLYQFVNDNPKHTIITGDRGIGKSSLLLQTKLLAQGNDTLAKILQVDLGVERYDFIVAWHDADHDQTPKDISVGLLKELDNIFQTVMQKVNVELDIAGFLKISEKTKQEQSISHLVAELCKRLDEVSRKAKLQKKHGVLLFVDELDRVKPDAGIATFFKLTTERLNREGIRNVGFFCAGITGAIQRLEDEHKSIARTFRDIPIPRLSFAETKEIILSGFTQVGVSYEESVIPKVHALSAGFPEPVHLLGSEMLSVSEDDRIDECDFESAKKKIIGDVKKNKLTSLLKQAGTGKYQLILQAMSKYEGSPNVPLDYISQEIGYDQNQYSTNMATLIERGIISRESKGLYSFVDPLLKEYIKAFGVLTQSNDSEEC